MDTIKTSDIYYGAYLLSSGGKLEGFRLDTSFGSRKVFFEFSGTDLEGSKTRYLSGQAVANIRDLRSSIKHLKDIILNERTLTLKERHAHHEYSVR